MSGGLTLPCPVLLGFVKSGGVGAELHRYTREKNLHNVEKLLKQGVDVDCVNNLHQTSLYCASLLGFTSVAELLLRFGADPNHRSNDRSTPVHAAAFSCNTDLLRRLLEAGGDLRLHDNKGKTARDWAECEAQEGSVKMISFISSCMSVTRSLSESQSLRERDVTLTSSKTLLDFIRPFCRASDMVFNKKITSKTFVSDTILCLGYEKLCVEKLGTSVGALASVPFIPESELLQADDEALHSFTCGTFTKMTNYSWRGIRITLKELQVNNPHPDDKQHYYHDLLITELNFCCRLFHPHLLQLMAVIFTNELQQNKLVYERVHVGSLYHLLYHRRAEFPILRAYEVLSLILQVCEALFYLHSRSLVLRSLCSHSVVIVHPGVAKVTGLGFMGPSDCSPFSTPPIPEMLYNWAAPEVIRNKACSEKADLYSVCALIQELYTDAVPWGSVNPDWIKQAVDAGQALCADSAVPQPYYDLVLIGLQPKAHERTCSLQDLRFLLRSNLRELSKREERREGCPLPASSSTYTLNTALEQNWDPQQPDEQQVVDQDILDYPDMNDRHAEIQSSFSNHISNIVLNLKVCKVLVQETEPCLAVIESRMKGSACPSGPGFDEPDGMKKRREELEVMPKPVGPPSKYCDSFRMYQSSEECRSQELKKKHQSEHTWTSEVSTSVARGFLGAAAGALGGSSDSEEVQEDAQLEQLFKSFAGVESESEESTAFHTIILHEAKGQHQMFDSDEDEDPGVTMEVCRPYMTAESLFGESFSSPEESQHTEAESVLPSAHTTSSHTEDIADLSSITCSPAQLYEQAGQIGAQPRPRSTDVAPCNSTPRSPHTHRSDM
ncbi:inactive serine/threonine-protein kinase TEX14-like isoform X1 [Silurus meridionalis]|uniref:inactive serine/threonine-protein kinase TEX14-like isoform X1 n=1 Tax=Silurus meridionalis TaxID=175797 RepID=UPI001EEA0054|nr:inactive serine/threonine-protein kinase TEX14-like isoform X1 [Silurus meridionalis]XP_046717706.1 inactive serine/threonine-protein kinase TEX14-like isoform X1 [Silurus meridionalis]XP_046717707.1 inactive serine/threonine-protein kinase TEX14-like isoform X1 [Silurus meridionalis]